MYGRLLHGYGRVATPLPVVCVALAAACGYGANDGESSPYARGVTSSGPGTSSSKSGGTSVLPADAGVPTGGGGTGTVGTKNPAPPWAADGGTGIPTAPTTEQGAALCGGCHATIYGQWREAMHSNALVSPVMIAQTQQDTTTRGALEGTTAPDPQKFCINCHSPTVAAIATGSSLPQADSTSWRDGVTCTTCHQFNATSQLGGGGFTSEYQQGFISGNTYLGNLDSPVGNRVHTSQAGVAYTDPNQLCKNCHEVWIDLDKDGIEEKGIDLVLQTTWNEYLDYQSFGGKETCVSCHMPVVPNLTRVADGAQIPADQFTAAPPRVVHDHSFVGPDHVLDNPVQGQAQAAQRTALLQSAVTFQIDRNSVFGGDNGGLGFDVFVGNTGAGHDIPTGFAFARQMWVEVTVTDASGNVVDGSGLLANDTDDLCDGNVIDDDFFDTMQPFIQGCRNVDFELTTFQQRLVSVVDATEQDRFLHQDTITADVQDDFGSETWLQYLRAGVVARQRFSENGSLTQLLPFEFRDFHYDVQSPGPGGKVAARLLFRSLPGYFLRALAQGSSAITPLIGNLEIVQMATDEVSF